MKNSTNTGYDQHYNMQVAVGQGSLLIVAQALSNHPNDNQEAAPTLDALPPELWASQTRRHWTTATSAKRRSRHASSAGSSRTLRRGEKPIIWIGTPFSTSFQTNRPQMPARQ
jgi:hypothetical protein